MMTSSERKMNFMRPLMTSAWWSGESNLRPDPKARLFPLFGLTASPLTSIIIQQEKAGGGGSV